MNDAAYTIRRASPNEIDALVAVEQACFADPWSRKLIEDAIADCKYLVLALEDAASGEVVGYSAAWHVVGEAQVDRIAVLPARRRLGLGRILLRATLAGLKQEGAALVFLEVRAGNSAATAMYLGAGFEVVGTRRAYYEDGEDALVMSFANDLASSST